MLEYLLLGFPINLELVLEPNIFSMRIFEIKRIALVRLTFYGPNSQFRMQFLNNDTVFQFESATKKLFWHLFGNKFKIRSMRDIYRWVSAPTFWKLFRMQRKIKSKFFLRCVFFFLVEMRDERHDKLPGMHRGHI